MCLVATSCIYSSSASFRLPCCLHSHFCPPLHINRWFLLLQTVILALLPSMLVLVSRSSERSFTLRQNQQEQMFHRQFNGTLKLLSHCRKVPCNGLIMISNFASFARQSRGSAKASQASQAFHITSHYFTTTFGKKEAPPNFENKSPTNFAKKSQGNCFSLLELLESWQESPELLVATLVKWLWTLAICGDSLWI